MFLCIASPEYNNQGVIKWQLDYKGLGNRIREERLRLHLTQAQIAEAVDISDLQPPYEPVL